MVTMMVVQSMSNISQSAQGLRNMCSSEQQLVYAHP